MEIKFASASLAIAFANNVFPVPGGPSNNTPLGISAPAFSYNVEFFNWKETKPEWLSEEISKSEVTFITPESVSTLYESLSTKTKVYVFDMPLNSDNNGKIRTKVTRNIDKLKKSKEIGFINTTKKFFSSVVESIELSNPENNNPLSEVKRVAELLLEEL